MTAAQKEEIRVAHRELVAARRVWTREFRLARATLMHENLLPAARQMDAAFKRFVKAARTLAAAVKVARAR